MRNAALGLVCFGATFAHAASRQAFGGAATIAYAGPSAGSDPLLADSPAQAALLQLDTSGICRDTPAGLRLELAQRLSRPTPGQLVIDLSPGLKSRKGAPLTALDVAAAWARVFEASPYRALFAPVKGQEQAIRGAANGRSRLQLPLAYPWPDLERSLCHPALAITVPAGFGARSGVGPFTGSPPGVSRASLSYPAGRPFLDRVTVESTDERTATRQFALGHAQVELNTEPGVSGPMRWATYLLFRPERVGNGFRESVASAVDRGALVRLFVRAPAAPMAALLPGAAAPPVSQPTPSPRRAFTLLYDTSADSQRPVAERIALKLHDRGYDVHLDGLSHAQLQAHWARQDFDAMLGAVLLPAQNGPALAVALELANQHALLATELPRIGEVTDLAGRDALALQRATALTPLAEAIPLYVQGVRVRFAPRVVGTFLDALGVPDLAELSLALDGQLAAPDGAGP